MTHASVFPCCKDSTQLPSLTRLPPLTINIRNFTNKPFSSLSLSLCKSYLISFFVFSTLPAIRRPTSLHVPVVFFVTTIYLASSSSSLSHSRVSNCLALLYLSLHNFKIKIVISPLELRAYALDFPRVSIGALTDF